MFARAAVRGIRTSEQGDSLDFWPEGLKLVHRRGRLTIGLLAEVRKDGAVTLLYIILIRARICLALPNVHRVAIGLACSNSLYATFQLQSSPEFF